MTTRMYTNHVIVLPGILTGMLYDLDVLEGRGGEFVAGGGGGKNNGYAKVGRHKRKLYQYCRRNLLLMASLNLSLKFVSNRVGK